MTGFSENPTHPAIIATLVKPFELETLQKIVGTHVGRHGAG